MATKKITVLDEGAPLAGEGLEPEPRPQRRHLCGIKFQTPHPSTRRCPLSCVCSIPVYLRQHEPNSLVDFHTGRYHGLVGAGARRRAHPEAAPRPRRSGAYEVGGPPTRSGPAGTAGTCRAARKQRRRLARAKEEKQGSDD